MYASFLGAIPLPPQRKKGNDNKFTRQPFFTSTTDPAANLSRANPGTVDKMVSGREYRPGKEKGENRP
jgi:hypothetical protein